jgi:hypothetical protein
MRFTLLIFALLFASTAAHAGKVYKWVDEQGNVMYTDQPRKGAQEIKIAASPPANVARPSQTSPRELNSFASRDEALSRYSALTFSMPTKEETVRDNAGNVTIALNVVPSVAAGRGDRIKVRLDGHVLDADFDAPEVVLAGVDQGTHTLQAAVTDKNGRVLISSDTVTFYVKYWSLNNPIGPGNYPATYPPQPYPPVYPSPVYPPVYPPSGTPKPKH